MIYYVYDLYPRDDPAAGTRLVRFTMLQLAEYFHQRNGTGAGRIAIRADETDAGFIEPDLLQYVRVVRVNDAVVDGATLSGFDEHVPGGFFLEEADFVAIDTDQTRLLTARGAGTLAYLDRAQMDSHTYLDGIGAMDPFDGIWRLYAAGAWSGGGYLGANLWRIITEAQAFQSGAYTHRHGDGLTYTDTHDDDRTENPIPAVTMTFDQFEDSDGNPWTTPSGEFTASVGESVLSVTKRLMEAGLYVELDPDTFELSAWEVANHGRDRTGLAWGADVVRFEPPTDEDQSNGNILNDLKRAIRALIRRTRMLVGGQGDVYGSASAAGSVKWEGFYPSDVADVDALEAVAARQITALDDAADTVRVRLHVANDPGNGSYLPGEHVRTDDTVTLHTGADPWDWDEAAYPVAQWSIKTRHAGDTDAFVDLGSMYFSTADRQFQVPGGPGKHTHPPNPRLCDHDFRTIATDTSWLVKLADTIPSGWNDAVPVDESEWSSAVTGFAEPAGLPMIGSELGTGGYVPSREILLRRAFWINAAELSGADVAFKYAIDNGGEVYVNGQLVATLGTRYTADSAHYTSDHATTLARSYFREGYNVVAIRAWNESSGSAGATPPGPVSASLTIAITADWNFAGSGGQAARCEHHHPEYLDRAAHDLLDHGGTALVDAIRAQTHGLFLGAFHNRGVSPAEPFIMGSVDGKDWQTIFGPIDADNASPTYAGDPTLTHWDGKFWLTHQFSSAGRTKFSLYSSENLTDWTEVGEIAPNLTGLVEVYPGTWARNEDGTVYLDSTDGRPRFILTMTTDTIGDGPFVPYEMHPTNDAMTTWSDPVEIAGDFPADIIDPFVIKHGDEWAFWYKSNDPGNEVVEYATSSTLTGTYTVQETGDWAGWGTRREAPCLVKLDDGRWRIYIQEYDATPTTVGIFYSESTDDWATWSALTQLTTDFADDDFLSHGDVIYLPGIYDHMRDPDAHADRFDAVAATRWHPLMAQDPDDDHWYVVVDGDGTAVMVEAP